MNAPMQVQSQAGIGPGGAAVLVAIRQKFDWSANRPPPSSAAGDNLRKTSRRLLHLFDFVPAVSCITKCFKGELLDA